MSTVVTPWNLQELPWQCLLVTGDTEPELAIFYNQANLLAVELRHQPSHKTFNL